jgi:hypothetical protein
MSLEYHNVLKFTTNGSKGSMSGKVAPSGIYQAMKEIRIKRELKWNSYP